MKLKIARPIAFLLLLILAEGAFALRLQQLRFGFDEAGLPIGNSGTGTVWIVLLCAAAAVLAVLCALPLKKRPAFADNFRPSMICILLGIAAAALIGAGSVVPLVHGEEKLISALGTASALCLVAWLSAQYKGAKPMALAQLLPLVWWILRLIIRFRGWSHDPVIADYCFRLFAAALTLLALVYLVGFVFGQGKRRAAAFFCMMAAFFCLLSLADGGTAENLTSAGFGLWMLTGLWGLLG